MPNCRFRTTLIKLHHCLLTPWKKNPQNKPSRLLFPEDALLFFHIIVHQWAALQKQCPYFSWDSMGRKRESRYKKRAIQTLLEIEVKGGRSEAAAIVSQSTRWEQGLY